VVRPWRVVFLLVLVASAVRIASVYETLPPFVASHFGANGRPNAWMSRSTFGWFLLVPFGSAVLVALITPLALAKLPPSIINLPNKDHWLAPERRDATIRRCATRMEWFGVAVVVFFAFVYELVFRANLSDGTLANGPFIAGMMGFVVFTIGWLVSFFRAFARPD
jgi:uncharacterized membrane protein